MIPLQMVLDYTSFEEVMSNRPTAEDVMNNAANVFRSATYLGSHYPRIDTRYY